MTAEIVRAGRTVDQELAVKGLADIYRGTYNLRLALGLKTISLRGFNAYTLGELTLEEMHVRRNGRRKYTKEQVDEAVATRLGKPVEEVGQQLEFARRLRSWRAKVGL